MKRYYFYKRNNNIREDLKGDLIDFSLSALYGEKAYSQKKRKELSEYQFERFKKLCKALIFERSSLDISNILPHQKHSITILDI